MITVARWTGLMVVGLTAVMLTVSVLPVMAADDSPPDPSYGNVYDNPSIDEIICGWGFDCPTTSTYEKQSLNFDANGSLKSGTLLGGSDMDPINGPVGGPIQVASQIVNLLLTTLGLFCLAVTVYGGYIWMMARGNEEEAKRAKDIITGTVMGLFFILASYGITAYVFRSVVNFTN